jgi:hypothetical protein
MGSPKYEIDPETLGMKGMVGGLSREPCGQTITSRCGSRQGYSLQQ